MLWLHIFFIQTKKQEHIKDSKLFAKTDDFINVPSLFTIIKSMFRKKNK